MTTEKREFKLPPMSEEYRQACIEGAWREQVAEALTEPARERSWLEVLCAPQSEVGRGSGPKPE